MAGGDGKVSYVIDQVAESHHRTYEGRNGTTYVFKVTTTEGAEAEVGKLKGAPQKGDVYNKLSMPSEKAPQGALPTLSEKDTDASPPPLPGSQNGSQAGSGSRGFGYQTNPEDAKRMGRCHAQEMALRWAHLQLIRGKVPDDFGYEQLTPIIDWFERDIA